MLNINRIHPLSNNFKQIDFRIKPFFVSVFQAYPTQLLISIVCSWWLCTKQSYLILL